MDKNHEHRLEDGCLLGDESNGARWWLRTYRNEFRVEFHSSVRRTFTNNLNDGVASFEYGIA